VTLIEADEAGRGEEADHGVRTQRRIHPRGERRDDRGARATPLGRRMHDDSRQIQGEPPVAETRPMPTASPAASAHTEKNECCHAIAIASRRRGRKPTAAQIAKLHDYTERTVYNALAKAD
jgi:hypothetical protein